MKKRFEVKMNKFTGERAIFVDDRHFDWEIDRDSLEKAKQMGVQFYIAAQVDIQKHFLDSLSDFMGCSITEEAFQEAIKTGWI